MGNTPAVLVDSSTWRAVKLLAEEEIVKALGMLEAPGTTHEESQYLRGQITALRNVLRLSDPPILVTDTDPHY